MTDAPEKIWARVRTTSYTIGINREVGELRDWCEGYATPEIAQTCGSTEYTRSDMAQARMDMLKARIEELEAELAAIEFALDGQDPSERADLKLARLKVSRIRAALKGTSE